jgi:hypothetical protein
MLYFCQFVSSEVISLEEINPSFSFQVHKIIGFGPTVLQVRILAEIIAPLFRCRFVDPDPDWIRI